MTLQENPSKLFNPIQIITIENFQAHEKTILTPAGPGQLTVIVGQSRQGKTAIFRALRWLFYNAPDGDDFIRWGATFARVTAEYADSTKVIRYRTKGGVNRYIVQKPGQLEQMFEGFGRGAVPLEVQQVTGVSPVEIGEGLSFNLNLAEQLDGPFLGNKSVSSTGRAKVLGKLAGTEEVDQAAKTLGTDLFRWRRDRETRESEIRGFQERLQGYEYLTAFKANLDKLIGVRDQVKADMERREKLNRIRKEINTIKVAISVHIVKIQYLDEKTKEVSNRLHFLDQIILRLRVIQPLKLVSMQINTSLQAAELTISSTQGLSQAEYIIQTTEERFRRWQEVETIIPRWSKVIYDSKQVDKVINDTNGILKAKKLNETSCFYLGLKEKLNGLLNMLDKNSNDMAVVERQMERTAGIELAGHISWQIYTKVRDCESLNVLVLKLRGNENNIVRESVLAQDAEMDINKYQDKYYEILKCAGKCPVCGGEVSKEKIGEVI